MVNRKLNFQYFLHKNNNFIILMSNSEKKLTFFSLPINSTNNQKYFKDYML